MEVADAIYLKARDLILADSAMGGMNNSVAAYYVRGGVRRHSDPPRTPGRPSISFEIVPQEKGLENNQRQADVLIRARIYFDRDAQRPDSESLPSQVCDRLHFVLRNLGAAWGTKGTWDIGSCALLRPGFYAFDGKETVMISESRIHADER